MKARHLLILPALALLSACAQDLYEGIETDNIKISKTPVYLAVYPEAHTFTNSGNEPAYGQIYAGSPWKMSGIDSSWLTVSPSSGDGKYESGSVQSTEVTYTATENTAPVTRTSLITVTVSPEVVSNGETSTYTMTQYQTFSQYGTTPYLTFSESISKYIEAHAATYGYSFTTNVPEKFLSVKCETDGCSATIADGMMSVKVSDNPSSSTRYIYLYVYSQETQVASLTLYQSGYSSSISATSVSIPGQGGSNTVNFTGTVDWTVTLPENAWVSVSPASGTANEDTTVTVSAEGNTTGSMRSCYIYFTSSNGNNIRSLYITQDAYTTSGSAEIFNGLSARGVTRTMTLLSPYSWVASPTVDWISVSPVSGYANDDTEITITVSPNTTSADIRYGNIRFYNSDNVAVWTVSLNQRGAKIIPSTTNVELEATSGAYKVVGIDSDAPWQVISQPEWLSVAPANGEVGETSVSIGAESENPSLVERSGTLTLGAEGTKIQTSIIVSQLGKDITPGQSEINVDWREQPAVPLTIDVPGDWTAASSVNWASVSPTSGTGTAEITVSIEANPSNNSRRGTVQVVSEGKAFNIPVNQGGRYLLIDNQSGEIAANGGTVEFSVDATVDYTTEIVYPDEQPADWLTLTDVSTDGVTRYSISAIANSSIYPREASVVLSSNDVNNVIFKIKQEGRSIRLSSTQLSISGNGGTTADITVDADGTYSVSTTDTWFSIIEGSNNNFHLAVTPNDSGANRTGTVNVSLTDTPDGETYTVTVTITQNNSRIDFDLDGFGPDQDWN